MKITFIIKKTAKRYNTTSQATIYVRLRDGRNLDSVSATKLSINPNHWDNKAEQVRSKVACPDEIRTYCNEEIRKLKTHIEKKYQTEKKEISKEWLKSTVNRYYNPESHPSEKENINKYTIADLCDEFLEKHKLSEVRKKNFRVIKRALIRYELFVRKTYFIK